MTATEKKRDLLNWIGLALVCSFFLVTRWKKMGSLLWLDPARWLNEFARVAHGEMPYRDFSFQYPPFAAFFYGWLLRWFGITFTNVQIITDLLDLAIIILCYLLIRRLLPRSLQLAAGALLVAVCATSLMNFNFFSYVSYIPSLQTGAVGALLFLLGQLRYLDNRRTVMRVPGLDSVVGPAPSSARDPLVALGAGAPCRGEALNAVPPWALMGIGGFIAVLSKPEYALATVCAIGLLAWMERDIRLALKQGLVAIGPALLVYALLAKVAGLGNMRAGIGGYGLATAFCPWWPTGVGVFGILGALGEAALVAWLLRRKTAVLGLIGGLIFAAYIAYQNKSALIEPGLPLLVRVQRILPSLLYTSAVLQPVMWVSIVAFLVFLWRKREHTLVLILLWPVIMSTRSLFGSTQSIFPEVTAVDYPFLLALAPYFIWRYSKSTAITAAFVISYSLIRVAGGWSDLLSDRNYGVLDTPAGSVKLLNYDTDAQVYLYVMTQTKADDYLLDIPYGGGMNFATGRPSPIFTTQLAGMGWPPEFQQRDLDLLARHPPRVIVAQNEANFGTYWGFGQRGDRACSCPRLVWEPGTASWDPNYVFPLVKYIQKYYKIRARVGDKILLTPVLE